MERSAGLGEGDPIAAAVEQRQPHLRLEVLDRGGNRWLRPPELLRGWLEAAFAYDRVEAFQLMDRRVHRLSLSSKSKLYNFYQFNGRLSSPSHTPEGSTHACHCHQAIR